MLGLFEWISDEMSPPGDAYDPAVGRPRCKKCGKDAWLMWNGKYSAYCSAECQNSDKRKVPLRSSMNSLLPARRSRKPAKVNAFERAVAAKKAAKDIKAIAEKWAAQRKKQLTDDVYADDTQQKDIETTVERGRQSDSFAQKQAEEAEFHKMQTRLAQVAEELAKEYLRSQREKSVSSFTLPGTIKRPVDARVSHLNSSSVLSTEAAAVEQAFADELNRQAEEEERQRKRDISVEVLAQTRDLPQSAQARLSACSSPRRCKDKAIQARVQTPEGSGREDEKASNAHARRRSTGKDKIHINSKQRRDEEDYDRDCHRTTPGATTTNVRRAKYSHLVGHREQSTSGAVDKTACSVRRPVPFSHRWRDCATRESATCVLRRPPGDFVYARKKRPLIEKNKSTIWLGSTQDDTRLRQQPEDLPFWCRHPTHTPARTESEVSGFVQNKMPCANGAKLDEPIITKSRHLEKNYQQQPAEKPSSSTLSHVQQSDVASAALQQNTSEVLRVAGTSNRYVTLDDLQQLREAAWTETKMAMEEGCTCCVRGQYAGSLEVHVLSAENVNPARVSSDDRLYVIVRCQVAETEWVEKRSRCVRNLRWDESFSFSLMYEKYPLQARVFVQLWRKAPHHEGADLFVGEGEIPFPLTVTRCVLTIQLCWNTKLGGTVVDLDCGRLQIAVHLQRSNTGQANSSLTQTTAVSTNETEALNGGEQTRTLLQTRTASKGAQNAVTRRKICNSSRFLKTEPRKPTKSRANGKIGRDYKSNLRVEGEARKTAEGRAELKWRHTSTRIRSSHASSLGMSGKTYLLSSIRGSTRENQTTSEQGNKESSVTLEMHRAPSGRHGVRQGDTTAVTEKKFECSNTEEGHPLRESGRVSEETEPMEREEKQDFYAFAAPVSPEASPSSTTAQPGSGASAEPKVTKCSLKPSKNLASSSADVRTSTANSGVCAVELQEYVSDTTTLFSGKQQTTLDSQPRFRGPAEGSSLPRSGVPHERISEAELHVMLPVALAQMDDFAHYDEEPGRVAPAANLDPCVLVQPWCTGRDKWTHCANRSCRRIISNKFMNDLFEEEEFRAWGCCSTCQGEMFHTEVPSSTKDVIQISVDTGMYDEFRLESFIPLAFPSLNVIWPSSRHLYVAQRFTHVQIQDRLRQCRTQRELTFSLMAPLLKYFVRSDWSTYRRVALRTCVRLKIQQHPRLQLLLAGTGRALLYDPALPDFWEGETEDEAVRTNPVGALLMELRNEYL